MPRSRGNSRSSSQPGSPLNSPSRARGVGMDPRGDDARSSSHQRAALRGNSAPPTPTSYYNALASIPSPGFRKASLDDPKRHRRAKRSGYDHPAALPSAPDLLCMPTSCLPDHRRVPSYENTPTAAGVKSDRMAIMMRADIDDADPERHLHSPYSPVTRSDPLTHTQYECDKTRDFSQIEGAAGVRTDRLTYLQTNWITQHERIAPAKQQYNKTDPISHRGGPPPPITKGIRRFEGAHSTTKVPLAHLNVKPEKPTQKEVHNLQKKEVRTLCGDIIYNVAGEEDMLPAATHVFTKADLPPTAAHKRENERRFLPGFFRFCATPRRSPTLGQSEDMYYAMYGDKGAQVTMEKAGQQPDDNVVAITQDRMASFLTHRALEERRALGMNAKLKTGSPVVPYPVAVQSHWDRARMQRPQNDASGRTRRSRSADAYARRSSMAGSVVDSEVLSVVSAGSKGEGMGLIPMSARVRKARSLEVSTTRR